MRTEEDFFDLAWAYFERVKGMNVRYCEVFVDVQAHTRRGVSVQAVLGGLGRARKDAWGKLNVGFPILNSVFCFVPELYAFSYVNFQLHLQVLEKCKQASRQAGMCIMGNLS